MISTIKTVLQKRNTFLLTDSSRGDFSTELFPELQPDEDQTRNIEKLLKILADEGGVKILSQYLTTILQDQPTLKQLLESEIDDQTQASLLQQGLKSLLEKYSGLKKFILLLTVSEIFNTSSYDLEYLFKNYPGLKSLLTFFLVGGGLDSLHKDIEKMLTENKDTKKILEPPSASSILDGPDNKLDNENSLDLLIKSLPTKLAKSGGIKSLPKNSQSILKKYPDIETLLLMLTKDYESGSLSDSSETLHTKYSGMEKILALLTDGSDLIDLSQGIDKILSDHPNLKIVKTISTMSDDPVNLQQKLESLLITYPDFKTLLTKIILNEEMVPLRKYYDFLLEQYPDFMEILKSLDKNEDYSSVDLQVKVADRPNLKKLITFLTLGYVNESFKPKIEIFLSQIPGLKKLLEYFTKDDKVKPFYQEIELIIAETSDINTFLQLPTIGEGLNSFNHDLQPKFSVTPYFKSLTSKIIKEDKIDSLPENLQLIFKEYPEFKKLLIIITTNEEAKSFPEYLESLSAFYPGLKKLLSLLTVESRMDSVYEDFKKILSDYSDLKMLFLTQVLNDDSNFLSEKYKSVLIQNSALEELLEKIAKNGGAELLRKYLESLIKQDKKLKDLIESDQKPSELNILTQDLKTIISESQNLRKLLTLITLGYVMDSLQDNIKSLLNEHKGLKKLLEVFNEDVSLNSLQKNIESLLADPSDFKEFLKSTTASNISAAPNLDLAQSPNRIPAPKETLMPTTSNEQNFLLQKTESLLDQTLDHKVQPKTPIVIDKRSSLSLKDSSTLPGKPINNATSQTSEISTAELAPLNQTLVPVSVLTLDYKQLNQPQFPNGSSNSLRQDTISQSGFFSDNTASSNSPIVATGTKSLNQKTISLLDTTLNHASLETKLEKDTSNNLSQDLDTQPSESPMPFQLDSILQGDDPDTSEPFKNIKKQRGYFERDATINSTNSPKDKNHKKISKNLEKNAQRKNLKNFQDVPKNKKFKEVSKKRSKGGVKEHKSSIDFSKKKKLHNEYFNHEMRDDPNVQLTEKSYISNFIPKHVDNNLKLLKPEFSKNSSVSYKNSIQDDKKKFYSGENESSKGISSVNLSQNIKNSLSEKKDLENLPQRQSNSQTSQKISPKYVVDKSHNIFQNDGSMKIVVKHHVDKSHNRIKLIWTVSRNRQ